MGLGGTEKGAEGRSFTKAEPRVMGPGFRFSTVHAVSSVLLPLSGLLSGQTEIEQTGVAHWHALK